MKTRSYLIPGLVLATAGIGLASAVQASSNTDQDQIEVSAQERLQVRAQLDATMYSEVRAEAWASKIEQDLKQSLAQVKFSDLNIREILCRATLCRVILEHRSQTGQQDVMQETSGTPGFDLPGLAHLEVHRDGTAITYIYLQATDSVWPNPGK